MTELELQTKIDTRDSSKQVDKLIKKLDALIDSEKEVGEQGEKSMEQTADGAEKAEGKVSTLSKGFKGLGTAIKAAGIGLLIAALVKLGEAFGKNQAVMDKVSEVMETINIVFSQVTNSIVDAYESVNEAGTGFENLGKLISNLITLQLTPLKTLFYGIKLGVQELMLAWEDSIFGSGDTTKIEELKGSIAETKDNLVQVGKDAIQAGSELKENFINATEEIGAFTKSTVDNFGEISVAAAKEQAKQLVELRNNAKLAQVEQQILLEQYDRQAEKLRQIRDDDRLSTRERIKANEDLADVLEKQESAMLAQAQAQIDLAQAELAVNDNIENQVALKEALANKEGILAQIEGFRSEQLINRNSLIREQEEDRIELLDRDFNKTTDIEAKKAEAVKKTQEQIRDQYKKTTDEVAENIQNQLALEQSKEAAKQELISKGFQIAQEIAGENFQAQKGIAAAQATYDTFVAVNKTLSTTPAPFNIPLAIATGAFGLLQVRKILSTQPNSGGSAGGSISGGQSNRARQTEQPRVPDVGAFNRGVGGGQGGLEPQRAYVVNQEIKDKSKLAQRIEDSARLG